MNSSELMRIAGAMVARGKGILAADESGGTIKKRGRKKDEILQQVDRYWVSRGLKLKVKEYVVKFRCTACRYDERGWCAPFLGQR